MVQKKFSKTILVLALQATCAIALAEEVGDGFAPPGYSGSINQTAESWVINPIHTDDDWKQTAIDWGKVGDKYITSLALTAEGEDQQGSAALSIYGNYGVRYTDGSRNGIVDDLGSITLTAEKGSVLLRNGVNNLALRGTAYTPPAINATISAAKRIDMLLNSDDYKGTDGLTGYPNIDVANINIGAKQTVILNAGEAIKLSNVLRKETNPLPGGYAGNIVTRGGVVRLGDVTVDDEFAEDILLNVDADDTGAKKITTVANIVSTAGSNVTLKGKDITLKSEQNGQNIFAGGGSTVQLTAQETLRITNKKGKDAGISLSGENTSAILSAKDIVINTAANVDTHGASIRADDSAKMQLTAANGDIRIHHEGANGTDMAVISSGWVSSTTTGASDAQVVLTANNNILSLEGNLKNRDVIYAMLSPKDYPSVRITALVGDNQLSANSWQAGQFIRVIRGDDNAKIELSARQGTNRLWINHNELQGIDEGEIKSGQLRPAVAAIEFYPVTGGALSTATLVARQNELHVDAPKADRVAGLFAMQTKSNLRLFNEREFYLEATEGDNSIWVNNVALENGSIYAADLHGATAILKAPQGTNHLSIGDNPSTAPSYALTDVAVISSGFNIGAVFVAEGQNNILEAYAPTAVKQNIINVTGAVTKGNELNNVRLTADKQNILRGLNTGINATKSAKVLLTAGELNQIEANENAVISETGANVTIEGPLSITAPVVAKANNTGTVNLHYKGTSTINGHLLAMGDNSKIDVHSTGSTLQHEGDSIALNGGVIEEQFTSGSVKTGRVDDFSAATETAHKSLFGTSLAHESLPSDVQAGTVNIALANQARWNVTGQSWVSTLGGAGGIVDVRAPVLGSTAQPEFGRALHIGTLNGSHQFMVSLNKDDYSHSDMIYIKQGTSDEQTLVIKNFDDLAAGMSVGERVRFATVQQSGDEFRHNKLYSSDAGLLTQNLRVQYVNRSEATEQDAALNTAINGEEFAENKAGETYTQTTYGGEGSKNVYLVKEASTSNPDIPNEPSIPVMPSRPAQVAVMRIPDLSIRYASQLDTYAKREGLRAYANPAEQKGLWVRATRFGLRDGSNFSLKGNEYEIGADFFTQNQADKKRKWGVSYTYGTVGGEMDDLKSYGHLRKHMVSIYNTNHFNDYNQDAYYNDNVLRVGILKSEYSSYRNNGQLWGKGDYRQYFFTVSTEHGYRMFLNKNKDWYMTPQVQLQYTHLGGQSYTTSNNVHVKLGHGHSLIGRIGTDLVKVLDKDNQSKIYARASVLREFMGKQSIDARDRTGTWHDRRNVKGTWGAVGVGVSIMPSKNSYVFLDGETEFGAHRKGYNFRLGVSWKWN